MTDWRERFENTWWGHVAQGFLAAIFYLTVATVESWVGEQKLPERLWHWLNHSPAASSTTRIVVAAAAVALGYGLSKLKRANLNWYARIEGVIALNVIADTVRTASAADVTTGLKLCGGIYLVVRALDNYATAEDKRKEAALAALASADARA